MVAISAAVRHIAQTRNWRVPQEIVDGFFPLAGYTSPADDIDGSELLRVTPGPPDGDEPATVGAARMRSSDRGQADVPVERNGVARAVPDSCQVGVIGDEGEKGRT